MVARLLKLGPIEIEKFTLTKDAIELVDKEFAQVNPRTSFFAHFLYEFSSRSTKKSKKPKLVLNNRKNN